MLPRNGDLIALRELKVFRPVKEGFPAKSIMDTWEMVDGRKNVKAHRVAGCYQDRDPGDCRIGISVCFSPQPSHLQIIFFGALENGVPEAWAPRIPSCKRKVFSAMNFSRSRGLGFKGRSSHFEIACAGVWPELCAGGLS